MKLLFIKNDNYYCFLNKNFFGEKTLKKIRSIKVIKYEYFTK